MPPAPFRVISNEPVIIRIPDQELLVGKDGLALAQTEILPLRNGLISGPQKIRVVIPESRPLFGDYPQKTVTPEFFAGLFKNLLIDLRDRHRSELKINERRDSYIGAAKKTTGMAGYGDEAESKIEAFVSYTYLEKLFWDRVELGVLHTDGSTSCLDWNRIDLSPKFPAGKAGEKLVEWFEQAQQGLIILFNSDLQSIESKVRPAAVKDSGPRAETIAPGG